MEGIRELHVNDVGCGDIDAAAGLADSVVVRRDQSIGPGDDTHAMGLEIPKLDDTAVVGQIFADELELGLLAVGMSEELREWMVGRDGNELAGGVGSDRLELRLRS